ncbi:ROK family protein [Microbacterium betulae]|uniref:ROK family protein n=1 Tax=Microbacterium betulae TaxID=2981139 RepID=A0AA97FHA1_9MICO|nr:ROK family protein [Microbacterium sp. AB]WOF23153.1 ROK family protein [Microbacterium sp. AB]
MSPAGGGMSCGVDVGGTTVKALLVDDGVVVREHRAPTPVPDTDGSRVVSAVARAVTALDPPEGTPIGVAVPGVVDEERGTAILSANIGFRDAPLAAALTAVLDRPVAFGQDVRAGALAERHSGAARDAAGPVVFVPVGTGVAAAILIGETALVSGGWAGEIGQQLIAAGPHAGRRVEEVASASALARRAHAPDARAVAVRVAEGDPDAVAAWTDTVETLADALAGLTTAVGAATIVVGGGLSEAGPLLLDPLAVALARRLPGLRMPRVVAARHGDRAGAIGAALLASRLLPRGAA